jgi:uncharacterized protein YjiK
MVSRIGSGWSAQGVSAPRSGARAQATRFEPKGRLDTGVKEASDVVALPGGRFLVAGDTADALRLVEKDGSVTKLPLDGLPKHKPSQFEGIAYDPNAKALLLSREESRELLRYAWDANGSKAPSLEKTYDVKHLGGPKNKGLEGLAFLPGDTSPTGLPQLLGTKEGKPRELVMFDAKGGKHPLEVKLDDRVKDVCHDFSAVTVDPKSGHVFISSDESSTIAELSLSKKGDGLVATYLGSFPVKDEHGDPLPRIEGLTFDAKGDLFVLTENDGKLLHLARQ